MTKTIKKRQVPKFWWRFVWKKDKIFAVAVCTDDNKYVKDGIVTEVVILKEDENLDDYIVEAEEIINNLVSGRKNLKDFKNAEPRK